MGNTIEEYISNRYSYPINIATNTDIPIFNRPEYIEGEYVWSYIARIAEDNGFIDANDLLNNVFTSSDKNWRNYLQWSYDVDRPILKHLFPLSDYCHIIENATLYKALLPFNSRWAQSNKLSSYSVDYDRDLGIKLITRPQVDITTLRVCPVCMKLDIEEGFFHYHKVHQMPGIKVCPIHGCELMEYIGVPGREFSEPEFSVVEKNSISESYAAFCNELVLNPLEGALYDTIFAIRSKLNEIYPGLYLEALIDAIEHDARFIEYVDAKLLLERIILSKPFHSVPVEDAITVLVILFGTFEEFYRYLPQQQDLEAPFLDAIDGKFDLLGEYSNSFVILRCHRCGEVFSTTPMNIISQLGCPSCNEMLTEKSIFTRMLSAADHGVWTTVDSFQSIGKRMSFHNTQTGDNRFCSAATLFFDSRYIQWNIIRGEELSNQIRQNHYDVIMAEISKGTFTVEEQENPHRFIATDGIKVIQDVGFTQLCNRVKMYISHNSVSVERKAYIARLTHDVAANNHHILFPDDYAPSPEFMPNVRRMFSRYKEAGKLERYCKNIYFHAGDKHSVDEILVARFFCRYGKYVGIPICDSLFSYLESGLVVCDEPCFALYDTKSHKSPKAVMEVRDVKVNIVYMGERITDDNWERLSAEYTIRCDAYIRNLDSRQQYILGCYCRKVGLSMDDMESFYRIHPRYARSLAKKIIEGDLDGTLDN